MKTFPFSLKKTTKEKTKPHATNITDEIISSIEFISLTDYNLHTTHCVNAE